MVTGGPHGQRASGLPQSTALPRLTTTLDARQPGRLAIRLTLLVSLSVFRWASVFGGSLPSSNCVTNP